MKQINITDITLKKLSEEREIALLFREKTAIAACADSLGVDAIELAPIKNLREDTIIYKTIAQHWGYNFYYSQHSKETINPFLTTDSGSAFPSGDAFSVYPGTDGPWESLRLGVFHDAIQDIRALKLLESFIGKEKTVEFMEETLGETVTFKDYPHSAKALLNLREKVNSKIKEFCK